MRATSLLLFVLSCLLGVWIAPDLLVAYDRFALLMAGVLAALALVWLCRRTETERTLALAGLVCLALAFGLSLMFLLTTQWSTPGADKFSLVTAIGLWLERVRPSLGWQETINGNVLAAGLVVLTPLGLGSLVWCWSRRQSLFWLTALALGAVATPIIGFALFMSASRGGWLSLILAALYAVYASVRPDLSRRPTLRITGDLLAIASVLALLSALAAVIFAPSLVAPLANSGVGGAGLNRAAVWQDGLSLVRDYRFTGAGLGSTMMVLSTYVYILHVGYLPHLHNLALQLIAEQGFVGMTSFFFLTGTALWAAWKALQTRSVARSLSVASLIALLALLFAGVADSTTYPNRLAPLTFAPLAFAWSLSAPTPRPRQWSVGHVGQGLLLALAPLVVSAIVFVAPGARAAFQANLGAVLQAQAELALYEWPEWPIQDALRRSDLVNLEPVLRRYAAALALDHDQVTANRRLGQIELGRGDYTAARLHLQTAYDHAPHERATRLLLGEVYAVAGETAQAVELWRGADTGQGELEGRRWWLNQMGSPEQVAAFDAALAQMRSGQ